MNYIQVMTGNSQSYKCKLKLQPRNQMQRNMWQQLCKSKGMCLLGHERNTENHNHIIEKWN